MADPATMLALGAAGTVGLGLASLAALKGWEDWLALRRASATGSAGSSRASDGAAMAELKARVRRLEAIASGEA